MLPPITNRTQPISCSRALPLNYWVAWNPPHLSKLALTGTDSQLTSGWTFRTHVFPVFRTRVMESLEVPYKQPLYSPNSISFLLWMKFSMVSRDTKKYSLPFVSWLLMCLEVSKGIENWIIDFSWVKDHHLCMQWNQFQRHGGKKRNGIPVQSTNFFHVQLRRPFLNLPFSVFTAVVTL